MKEYTYKEILGKVKKIVEEECKKDSNIYGYDAWNHHILRVVKFSKILAKKIGADKEIVELSAFLHDIGGIKGDPQNHHISGAKEAEKILAKLHYPEEKIKKIKHCIYAHRASKNIKRRTIEAKCLASADAISHFEDLPSLFYLVYKRNKFSIEDGVNRLLSKLERDWKKLIPEAKEMIKDKYKAIQLILG